MAIQKGFWKYKSLTIIFILLSLSSFSLAADTSEDESANASEVISSSDSTEESTEALLSDAISETTESSLESEESELQEAAKATDEASTVEAESTAMATSMSESIGGGTSDTGNGVYSSTEAVSTLYTGAAAYRLPISVPPGRKGMQPKLSLSYNSYSGNGWIGEGWSLDLGSIRRSTKRGLDYSADEYVSNGSELISRSDWGDNYYGAKIEGAFSKYHYNNTTGGWEVTTKAGMKYYYGTTSDSRQENAYGISKWCFDKAVDTNGNYMTVAYVKDSGQIYPSQIDYTGNDGLSTTKYVQFTLENRTDVTVSYATKSQITTSKRLQAISTYADGQLAREYVLSYEPNPVNGRSRLYQVEINGSDGESTFQPLTLGWLNGGDGTFDSSVYATDVNEIPGGLAFGDIDGDGTTDFIKYFAVQKSTESYPRVYAFPFLSVGDGTFYALDLVGLGMSDVVSVEMGDVNGDGYADIVSTGTGGDVYTYVSDGLGNFTSEGASSGASAADKIFLSDLNGDGLSDLVMHDADSGAVYSCLADDSGSGTFGACSSGHTGSGGAGEDLVKLANLNGDGYPDLIKQMGGIVYTYLGVGDGSFSSAGAETDSGADYAKDVKFADINGDGYSDLIVNSYDSSSDTYTIYTYLSIGNGSFVSQASSATGVYDNLSIGDVNGDGLTDIVEADDSGINYTFLSKGDGTFYDYIVAGGPGGTGIAYLIDVDGDGRSDLLKNGGACVCVSPARGDGPADHLQTVQNELGGTTTLEYTKSSEYQDNFIPFIMYPVSKITSDDNNGVVSDTYFSYSWPYYDYPEREFRGFEYVIQTNPDGTTVETRYDQYDEYTKGRPDEIQVKTPGGALLSKKTFTYSTYPETPTDYAFVKLDQKLTETYDTSTVSVLETYTYYEDSGYLHTSTVSSSTNPAETLTSTYVYENLGTWLWRLVQDTFEGSASGKMRETFYYYDANGNVISKEAWLSGGTNPAVEMGYDDYGNMTSITDAEDNTTTMTYDSATETYIETITYPSTQYTYAAEMEYDNRFGKATLSVDQNGNETEYSYDRYGRLVQADTPDGGQVIYTYHDNATPVYVHKQVKENANSYISTFGYYDGFGRPIQSKSFGVDDPIVSKAYYDEMGRVYRTEGPYFADGNGDPLSQNYPYGEVTYDWFGRQDMIEAPNSSGGVSQIDYDYDGLSSTVTDPDGKQKTYIKDFLGRITNVLEHTNEGTFETIYTYNAAGDMVQVEDAEGNITSITYDTLGRKIDMTDPDMGYWQYTYDANGNLVSQTDAKDQTITFAYDALNRVTSKTYSTSSDPTVTYTYDEATNGIGLLYSVTNSSVTSTINAYDTMGRATSVTKTINGIGRTTSTTYDVSGKTITTTYPSGYSVTNEYYPGTNLLNAVTGSDSQVYASISEYEPTGKIGRIDHGNDTYTIYIYDSRSTRLIGILTKDASNNIIQDRTYEYACSGDIQSIYDDLNNITYTYTYDDLHRLTDETNTGSFGAMHIEYDSLGNIVSKTTGNNSIDISYNYYSKPHAIDEVSFNGTSYGYTNDANGNMTQGWDFSDLTDAKKRSITWNADNMPISISYGSETTTIFIYDGLGSRARKMVISGNSSNSGDPSGSVKYTYYFGDHYEIKEGVAYDYIFAGSLRVAQIAESSDLGGSNEIMYFHKDHLGSSTLMTDASGAEIESTNYEPFGGMREHTGTTTSDYKFTDQELDAENGLYNYNARLYDPIIGRFISPDTIVPQPYNPQYLNRYSYCLNNPLIYTDPTGHENPTNPDAEGTDDDPYMLEEITVKDYKTPTMGEVWEFWYNYDQQMFDLEYGSAAFYDYYSYIVAAEYYSAWVEAVYAASASDDAPPNEPTPSTAQGNPATAETPDVGDQTTADVTNVPFNPMNSDDLKSYENFKKAADYTSIADIIPFGAVPSLPLKIVGEILDVGALVMTQAVLAVEYQSLDNISKGQYASGTAINFFNFLVGTAGNALTPTGNLVASGGELVLFIGQKVVTQPH